MAEATAARRHPMNTFNDNTAPKGLFGWWASPPRTGLRRIIAPWEYRHLRGFARLRIVGGLAVVGLAIVTLVFGGINVVTAWWTLAWLAMAVTQFAVASWLLAILRSQSAQT
jgi:hypothetical protein